MVAPKEQALPGICHHLVTGLIVGIAEMKKLEMCHM